jgi:hypothetical protein
MRHIPNLRNIFQNLLFHHIKKIEIFFLKILVFIFRIIFLLNLPLDYDTKEAGIGKKFKKKLAD